ncbi:MAG: peptidoglycan-associated lipoprotein Pal [Chiayiivirga sp.]|jgi:peptidoglycan-associated lipoprotein|uniref:peptidoglycan-associated lipoprotein Pal n=1 Tax=Chiayiivirga sp. TaxID=2041042 RepID=UPI0025B899FC|nr:peptidoglycan-associated lipoprotein Pal [Chiayiivirga sp.]MCI1709008.1 peptidoglycan-associated lipoprotein Pal [Chiayiivirga sp.]MCI1729376.1 peptidoglycan-associated lipoprotein Pal [Chiayiivirga sp.]
MNTTSRVLLAAALVASLAACSKKVKEEAPVSEPTAPVATAPAADDGIYGPEDLDTDSCLRQRVVYFDLDQDALKPEFASIMACHAKYLTDRPSARITLEGNADERGTREYNLGLGERRGNAVSTALQGNGGSASQLTVVSYGEERPTCTDSSEGCWSQNRRVEIVYTAK